MKIAFFVESFPQRSETFIVDQVEACIRRGYDVTVFTASNRPSDVSDPSLDHLKNLVATPSSHSKATAWRAQLSLMKLARAYGWVNVRQCLDFVNYYGPQYFDVIHAHFAPAGRRAALLKMAGYLSGKLITTFHGFDIHTLPRRYPLSYYKPIFENSDRLTTGSTFMFDLVTWMGAPKSKHEKIPMGIDLTKFSARTEVPLAPDRPLKLLSVGRLVEFKGHSLAIAAIALAHPRISIQYTIIGDGPLRAELESQIISLNLADSIHLAGGRPHNEIRTALKSSDALLHSATQASNGSVESQGVILAEAAASGLPIIATRSGGIPDSVIDQQNGILVEPDSPELLAAAIVEFHKAQGQWESWSKASREIAETRFDAHKLQQRFFELYESI